MDNPVLDPSNDVIREPSPFGNTLATETAAWHEIVDAAEHHNKPGTFTSLIGWEWSSIPTGANLHRIVWTPDGAEKAKQFVPFGSDESQYPEDLWRWLQDTEDRTGTRFIAMPHNSNLSKGYMYAENNLAGKPIDPEAARQRISVYVAVPTLEYLRRSGRVSFAQAALADLLAIKPILTMRNGWLEVVGKVRTYRRALERVISLVEEQAGRARVELAVVHANVPEAAEEFRRKIEARLNVVNTMIADIGSALAAHGGPGMLGLACLQLEAEPGPG